MAIEKIPATDGLKKEDTGATGADALTTGIDFLIDGAKTTPAWPDATNFLIHYAYGVDIGLPLTIYKLICYDNRDTDDWYGRDETQVWASDDNITYTLIQTFDGPPRSGGVWELVFDTPQKYRYFKAFCSEPAGDGLWVDAGFWCQLVELEAWGLPIYAKLRGTVQEKGSNVQRQVRAYIRSTGELYDSVTSNPDGSFELNAPDAETEMFIIAFDDVPAPPYNALIFDSVFAIFD